LNRDQLLIDVGAYDLLSKRKIRFKDLITLFVNYLGKDIAK